MVSTSRSRGHPLRLSPFIGIEYRFTRYRCSVHFIESVTRLDRRGMSRARITSRLNVASAIDVREARDLPRLICRHSRYRSQAPPMSRRAGLRITVYDPSRTPSIIMG